jgi:hypothetical protein
MQKIRINKRTYISHQDKNKEPCSRKTLCCTNRFRNIVDNVIYHVLQFNI